MKRSVTYERVLFVDAIKKLRLFLFPKTVYESPDGAMKVVDRLEQGAVVRVMFVDGVRESGVFLDEYKKDVPLFFYMRTLKAICLEYVGIDKALLIGGGGMAFARYFLDLNRMNTMTVVEKDQRCIEIAQKCFGIEAGERLAVENMPGETYISNTSIHNAGLIADDKKILFDLIIFDAFNGNTPVKELTTRSMLKLTKTLLISRGLLAINVINIKGGMPTMLTCMTMQYLKEIFRHVTIIPCENEGNSIILASDRELEK